MQLYLYTKKFSEVLKALKELFHKFWKAPTADCPYGYATVLNGHLFVCLSPCLQVQFGRP